MESILGENGLGQSQEKANESNDSTVHLAEGEGGEEQNVAIASVTGGAASLLDASGNVQYQFRTDGSVAQGMTYRVVQVQEDGDSNQTQVLTNTALPAGTQVAQTVLPYNNGESPPGDGQEQRFAYFPAVTVGGENTSPQQNTEITAASIGQVAQAGGQFYVMMSPQEVLQGQRQLAPRTTYPQKEVGNRTTRDERRRATHNEVERRRRDKINNWIVNLSKLIPDCTAETTKQGQLANSSKGGILSKACEYINELRTANARMAESLKDTERLSVDVELLQQQVDELKNENSILRAQLQSHGIAETDMSGN